MMRGQTGIDFLVAMAVFLLTVGFVVGFVPGLLAPFGTQQEHPVVADRTADLLAGTLLAGRSPGALNGTCTRAFFGAAADGGCPFDAAAPLHERVGIDDGYQLNVTVERADGGVLCADGGAIEPCPGGDRLAAGPPGGNSVTTAVRAVQVDGREATVVIRIW